MASGSFSKFLIAASVVSIGLSACTKPPTEEELLMDKIMAENQLMPATEAQKAEIAKADMLTQASFWGAEHERNPTDKDAAYNYARTLRAIGSSQRASEVAAQALSMHPNDRNLCIVLAKAAMDQGRADVASTVLFQALAVTDKSDASLLSIYGVTLDHLGEHDQARQQYDKALALSLEDPKIITNKALSYAMQGDAEQSETLLRYAVTLTEKPDPRVRQNLAMVLGLQGKFDEARELTAEDLPPTMVAANLEYYRSLLTPKRDWGELRGATAESK